MSTQGKVGHARNAEEKQTL